MKGLLFMHHLGAEHMLPQCLELGVGLASALEKQASEQGPPSRDRLFHFHVEVTEEGLVVAEKDVRFPTALDHWDWKQTNQ